MGAFARHLSGWQWCTALSLNLATNAFSCAKGCATADISRAFGLPESPGQIGSERIRNKRVAEADAPLRITCMADVEAESVRWLWEPRLALGKLTIAEGEEGIGKSFLHLALASGVTHGRLPGIESFEAGNLLLMSAMDWPTL